MTPTFRHTCVVGGCYLEYPTVMQAALEVFYRIPFAVLEVPNIRLKKPGFVKVPSAMVVFSFILFSYFLVTGGIIYDVIVEPPSIGSVNGTRDVSLTHTHTQVSYLFLNLYQLSRIRRLFMLTL